MNNQQKQAKQIKEKEPAASSLRLKDPLDNVDKGSEKEDKTLSNLSSGDTKQRGINTQDDTKLQLERSASLAVDNQLPKKCETIGCNGHATGNLKIGFDGKELDVCAECFCKSEYHYPKGHNWEGLTPRQVNEGYNADEINKLSLKTLKDLNKYKLIRTPVMMHPTKDGDWVELSDLKGMAIKWLRATKQVGTARKLADYKNIETANAVYEAIENIIKHLFDITEEDLYGRK